MTALADLTPKELRDLKRSLEARRTRRSKSIARLLADRSSIELRLSGVEREMKLRATRAKDNTH